MNRETRNYVEQIKARLQGLSDNELNEIRSDIETYRDEEQGKFDNMSEGLQQSPTGQAIEAAASHLTDAFDSIEEALSQIDDALDALDAAVSE